MPRLSLRPLLAALVAFLLAPTPAHASLLGEENGPLIGILAQATMQVRQLTDSLAVARDTYNETRKYVGMVEDARTAFADFQRTANTLVTQPQAALDGLFPDAQYLRSELTSPERWGRGTGELQTRVSLCLNGAGNEHCTSFYKALKAEEARLAIESTMGKAPAGRDDIAAVDIEAARAIAGSHNAANRAQASLPTMRALQDLCMRGTGADAMTACQAAANLAATQQLEQTALLYEQMAEANRLQAVGLAAQNAERKREVREAQARQKAISDGFRDMATMKLQTPVVAPEAP